MHNNVLDNLKKYKDDCENYRTEKDLAAVELLWFEEQDINMLNSSIDKFIDTIKQAENLLSEKKQNLSSTEKKIKHAKNKLGLFPRFRSWFGNKEVKALLNDLQVLRETRNRINTESNSLDTRIRNLNNSIKDANLNIIRYNKLLSTDIQKVYGEACIKLAYAEKEYRNWNDEYKNHKEYYDALGLLAEIKQNLEDDIQILRQFTKRLRDAKGGYDRRLIHDECEERFGSSNPNILIRELKIKMAENRFYYRKKLTELQEAKNIVRRKQQVDLSTEYEINRVNDKERLARKNRKGIALKKEKFNVLEKIDLDQLSQKGSRHEKETKTSSVQIKKIIIDGSNLCYEQDQYIGARALAWLTQNLRKQYDLIVVFDNGAYLSLGFDKSNTRELEETLFGSGVKVHRVQKERKADDTILKYAENEASCYVLSNDRFRDYAEAEVVVNNRIIRHEILGGKIIVHDLDISLAYL